MVKREFVRLSLDEAVGAGRSGAHLVGVVGRGTRLGVSGLICCADVEIADQQENNKCGFGEVDKGLLLRRTRIEADVRWVDVK